RDEPDVLQDTRAPAGAQVGHRAARVLQGSDACRVRAVLPDRDRQPVSGLPWLGWQARLRWRAADPAGDRRQARAQGLPRPLRRSSAKGEALGPRYGATMTTTPVALAGRRARPLLSWRMRKLLIGYSYLVPAVLCMLATVVVPIGMAIKMSLYNDVLYKPQDYKFIGLGNYLRLVEDPVFWLSLWNSVVWVFG